MADNDRTRGYRDNETNRRQRPQVTDASGDPLAELARLIGQQNESTPSYRETGAPAYGRQPAVDQGWAAPDPYAEPSGYAQGTAHRSAYAAEPEASGYDTNQYDPRYEANALQAEQGYGAAYPSDGDQLQAGAYADGQYTDPRYGDQHYAGDQRYDEAAYADPRYADPRYADPRYSASAYDDGAAQGYADPRYADPRYAEPNFGTQAHDPRAYASPADGYAQAPGGQSYAGQGYAGYGHQDAGQPQAQGFAQGFDRAYGNSYYGAPPLPGSMARADDDHRPAKRRGSIVTVLAVLALAVVGTAGAFGYRAVFVGSGAAVPPPVIKADTQPSKVVPATDPSNKPIQDRIGVKTERIVPRQEEPVQQAAPGQPRVISPWLAGQNPQAFPPASANIAPTGSVAPQSASAGEPKRVRTVPIRPQQSADAPGPRSSRSAPAAEPEEVAETASAPMALSPTGSLPPTQRPAARQAHAALTPNDAAGSSPFPTPLPSSSGAAATRGAVAGPFAVQVTSQRSEADAQASFRSLQQQFPSVLASRQPVIRRADLGERGTYYRAQIPFSSQSEASEFCSSLKAAGGQCVIARN